jgi:ABC-type multidrug transport system fused ATPase/permease subunit
VFQRLLILREHQPVQVYTLALAEAVSFLAIALLDALIIYFTSTGFLAKTDDYPAFPATSIVLALCGFLVCISYQRRPNVFFQGHPVDLATTVSAYGRYTYSWPAPLLAEAKRLKDLQYSDIPVLDARDRTIELTGTFKANLKRTNSMLRSLLLSHSSTFTWQHIYSFVDAAFMVAPQFVMYQLLRLLEARDAGVNINAAARFWVIALGIVIIAGAFANNQMWFLCYRLNFAVRAQLGGMIFDKSTRRKDVKGTVTSKKTTVNTDMDQADHGEPQAQPDSVDEPSAEDVEDQLKKTRQGVVNLIGVDAKRVSDFSTTCNMFLGAACRLAFSFAILGKLLGWQPLLAGTVVQLCTLPVNIYYSKKYTDGQKVLMEQRDKILAVVNEMLGGIRQIKFAALEKQWQDRILKVRNDQLAAQWACMLYDTVLVCLWLTGPVLLSATTIGVYALINNGLPPSIAFTTISILGQIEGTLAWLPELTTNMLDAYVSLKRIGEYLDGPEKESIVEPAKQVAFKDATISWPSDGDSEDIFTLRHLNIEFPTGELCVVSGRTGSGKSLLLAAILGEVELLTGKITAPKSPALEERHDEKANRSNWILPGQKAFVSQQPWLENATLKDNILFGLPVDKERYNTVISVCALEEDLRIMSDGDSTEIGANGINLSGGQKWRVTLARALYSRAGILVLDDIFSAVDAHVGKHIFEKALTGDICKGRTRILVTHHVSLCLPATKYEVHLGNGTVEYAGLVSDLGRNGVPEAVVDEEEEGESGDEITAETRFEVIQRTRSRSGQYLRKPSFVNGKAHGRPRGLSHSSSKADIVDDGGHAGEAKVAPKKFVEEENKETGWVKWSVYKAYLNACGGVPFWLVVAVGFGGYEALLLGRSWILRLWTENYERESFVLRDWYTTSNAFIVQDVSSRVNITSQPRYDDTLKFYLALYLGFAAAIIVEGTLRYLWVFHGSIKASRKLFEDLTYAVLRAPLRWLDTMPIGRVLNRFSADFNQVDSAQAYNFAFCLYNFMVVLGIIVAGIIVSPIIIVCAVVLLTICGQYALYYLMAARQLKRLESTAKSPVFELFSTALAGIGTIRAFDKQSTYINNMYARLDTHARMLYYMWLANRWLSWRLNCIGAFFAFLVAALVVSLKGMDAALSGFALGFALQYTEAVTWLLRNFAGVEMNMNSTERILEYSGINIEKQDGNEAPAAWPTEGRLEIEKLVVGYADDLPPVLKGLSFSVNRNERVGVVGRTGAGKSSLTLALFRFLEARSGSVSIDGIDISKISLHDLRSRLAIIPQDPVLFSGTIRSNLDPFDQHSDQELRDALERVHLISSASTSGTVTPANPVITVDGANGNDTIEPPRNVNAFDSLNSAISEGGLNLSQGQRQLLCLARAIVSRPKIMILDEATSAVDKHTDALIQRSIREEFQDATLIVIAHRLSTIADFERILVMDQGKAAEYDTPATLMSIEGGVFKGLVESSGEVDVLRRIILGETKEDQD